MLTILKRCYCCCCHAVGADGDTSADDVDSLIPGMRLYPSFEALIAYLTTPVEPGSSILVVRTTSTSRCRSLHCASVVAAVELIEKCLTTSAAVVGESPAPWLQSAHDDTLAVAASGLASPLLMYQAFLEFGVDIDPSRSDAAKAHEVTITPLFACMCAWYSLLLLAGHFTHDRPLPMGLFACVTWLCCLPVGTPVRGRDSAV
jgi:hypothetical protein